MFEEDISGEEYADQMKEMATYFMEVVESSRYDFHERLISYVVLRLQSRAGGIQGRELPGNPRDFMTNLEHLILVLKENYRAEYKKEILNLIDLYYPDRKEAFQEVLWNDRGSLAPMLVEKLLKIMEADELRQLMDQSFNNQFKSNLYCLLVLNICSRTLSEDPRYARFGFSLPNFIWKLFIGLIPWETD